MRIKVVRVPATGYVKKLIKRTSKAFALGARPG